MSFHAFKFFCNILKAANFEVELITIPSGITLSFDKDQYILESNNKVDILYGSLKQFLYIVVRFHTFGFFAFQFKQVKSANKQSM